MTEQHLPDPGATSLVLDEVLEERRRQYERHGDQTHLPDGVYPKAPNVILGVIRDRSGRTLAALSSKGLGDALRERTRQASYNEGGDGSITFEHILSEEWGEVLMAENPVELRRELVQLAAVAVQWVEAIDLRMEQVAAEVAADEDAET